MADISEEKKFANTSDHDALDSALGGHRRCPALHPAAKGRHAYRSHRRIKASLVASPDVPPAAATATAPAAAAATATATAAAAAAAIMAHA